MLVVSSETSGCDLHFLVSRNWCRDLKSMSRPHSLCLYCISMSQPRLDVATSFLLSSFLLLGHNFSFMLRHPSFVLSFQAGRDSNCWSACFLVATWTLGLDQVFSLITTILVATIPSSYPIATSFLSLNSSLQFFMLYKKKTNFCVVNIEISFMTHDLTFTNGEALLQYRYYTLVPHLESSMPL